MLAQWGLEEHSSLPQQTRTLEVQKSLPESRNAVVCGGISVAKNVPIVGSKSPWPVHPTVLTINPAHPLSTLDPLPMAHSGYSKTLSKSHRQREDCVSVQRGNWKALSKWHGGRGLVLVRIYVLEDQSYRGII